MMSFGVYDHEPLDLAVSSRSHTATRWHSSVQRVLSHMQTNLEEKQCSEGLASVGALSRFHFNRVFRQLTGIPPACFLTALRLEHAKCLLLTTDLSVTEICMDVGFASLGTFVSRFTQAVGVPPNALRRLARAMDGLDLRYLFTRDPAPAPLRVGTLRGQITAPNWFSGVICVGLYQKLLPNARPLACTSLATPGEFSITEALRPGTYVIAAAGLPFDVEPMAFLNRGVTVRATSRPFRIANSAEAPDIPMTLRTTTLFDPPILAPLPLMLVKSGLTAEVDHHGTNNRLSSKQSQQSVRNFAIAP
jgi:AraC family transcriptional regulator